MNIKKYIFIVCCLFSVILTATNVFLGGIIIFSASTILFSLQQVVVFYSILLLILFVLIIVISKGILSRWSQKIHNGANGALCVIFGIAWFVGVFVTSDCFNDIIKNNNFPTINSISNKNIWSILSYFAISDTALLVLLQGIKKKIWVFTRIGG